LLGGNTDTYTPFTIPYNTRYNDEKIANEIRGSLEDLMYSHNRRLG